MTDHLPLQLLTERLYNIHTFYYVHFNIYLTGRVYLYYFSWREIIHEWYTIYEIIR